MAKQTSACQQMKNVQVMPTTQDVHEDTTMDQGNIDTGQSNPAGDETYLLEKKISEQKEPRATGKGIRKSRKKKEPLVDVIDQLISRDKVLARRDVESKLFKIR